MSLPEESGVDLAIFIVKLHTMQVRRSISGLLSSFAVLTSSPLRVHSRTRLPAGQELWSAITDQYDIDDAGGIALLKQICFAQDRVEQLGLLEKQTAPQRPRSISNQINQTELLSGTCRVTTGRNEDVAEHFWISKHVSKVP